jgi:2-polyprenyl-3-methyl-5-hydroxy-6-metoxy-1,4-benzoquinol methylase
MPNLILRARNPGLVERMDDPHCDEAKLRNTYDQFCTVNRLVSGWGRIYRQWILPELKSGATSILDVGCGGGDVAGWLADRAHKDGFDVRITAIDPDERAIAFATGAKFPESIRFLAIPVTDLVRERARFDIVLSNHLLHHLPVDGFLAFLEESSSLSRRLVIHNDIRRSDTAYLGFMLLRPFFRNSFITEDGLLSIRRSYTNTELEQLLPEGWYALPRTPYRNLVLHRTDE